MLAGNDKDLRAKALEAANKPYTPPPAPAPVRETPSASGINNSINIPTMSAAPAAITTGFGGKKAPPPAPEPEL